jgi:hypothetical protein
MENQQENKNITPEEQPKTVIRTYESDIAEAIQNKKASQVSISIAETKKKQSDQALETKETSIGKNILMIAASLILLVGGSFGGYYLYSISPLAAKPLEVQTQRSASLIPADSQKVIDITGKDSSTIISIIKQAQNSTKIAQNAIIDVVFAENNSIDPKNKGALTRIGGSEFISKIGMVPPDIFTRSLGEDWMFGLYNDGATLQPFMVFTNTFFERAYAGALKWEPSMAEDFSKVFDIKNPNNSSLFTIQGHFEDVTIKNKDARQFKDTSGNSSFIYVFLDSKTVVFAKTIQTLNEIITRIEQQTYVR